MALNPNQHRLSETDHQTLFEWVRLLLYTLGTKLIT
jgi:hypothetical protein